MKSRKKGAEPVLSKNGLTFEQAIQRLEKIVADMEGAELPLEDVLKKYEEGTRLVRFCNLNSRKPRRKSRFSPKNPTEPSRLIPSRTNRPRRGKTRSPKTKAASCSDQPGA